MGSKTFIQYLQDNPKVFAIAKSDMCVGLLIMLKKQGLPLSEIKKTDDYSKFSKDDLETLVELLVSIKLLDKTRIGSKYIYYANKNTDEFLNIYEDTRKQFNI